MTDDELRRVLKNTLNAYYEFLGVSLLKRRNREFWDYHRGQLEELGYPIKPHRLLKGLVMKAMRELVNPGLAFNKGKALFVESRSSST